MLLGSLKLLGTTRLGDTDCGPFKGCVLWWSSGNYVQEQAPQGAMDCRLRTRRIRWAYGPLEELHDFGGGSRGRHRDY